MEEKFEPARARFVHEHLVRERSETLTEKVDCARSVPEGEGDVIVGLEAQDSVIINWVAWLYGQPLFRECEGDPYSDEDLKTVVALCTFAIQYHDYECANACLDAIRELLFEEYEGLESPLSKLAPVFKSGCENAIDMVVETLVYGPCADSGQLAEWLGEWDEYYI
jgi:hypothetical protein